ncbi:hypothetical protein [Actinopolyspora saharensis]|uniref:hypothetical protein n=1 Tax=Actinopolyspora saharensis TaxID=995062 RepID=UPI003F66ACB3
MPQNLFVLGIPVLTLALFLAVTVIVMVRELMSERGKQRTPTWGPPAGGSRSSRSGDHVHTTGMGFPGAGAGGAAPGGGGAGGGGGSGGGAGGGCGAGGGSGGGGGGGGC